MNQEILKKVELWKTHVTKEELKAIEEMSLKELEDAFGMDIWYCRPKRNRRYGY